MGSSTAPAYAHFRSMGELARAVCECARDLMFDFATRRYSDHVFLNMGIGTVLFARDEPRLYQALVSGGPCSRGLLDELMGSLSREMGKEPLLAPLSDEERLDLLYRMWLFTHGLSTLIAAGLARETSQQSVVTLLSDVGSATMSAALARHYSRPPLEVQKQEDQ